MRLTRLRSHPDFRLEGRSEHFQSCWEMELTPGEETNLHSHYETEELFYLVSGSALLIIEENEIPVSIGEVILIPPRHRHKIANPGRKTVRALSVESRFEFDPEADVIEAPPIASLGEALADLPPDIDEGLAIQKLVEVFNIGGQISAHLERALEDAENSPKMERLANPVLDAVLEITRRYRER